MMINITFVDIADEHFERQPSITTPRMSVQRFHQLLREGVFGPKVEVSYCQFKSGVSGDNKKIVGLEYTVRANSIDDAYFLERVLGISQPE